MDKSTKRPKHRGTIIVDTNVLLDLRTEVPKEFTGGEQRKMQFIQILPFLGKHGFDVLIPEEVVYEITQHVVVNDGKTLKSIAPYLEPEDRQPERRGFIHSFSQILEDKVPGVHILSSNNLTIETANYMRSLKEILEAYPHATDEARKALQKAWRHNKKGGLADKTMSAHIRNFALTPENGLVFDLSTDRQHEKWVADHNANSENIKILDTKGLIKAMHTTGLLQEFGVDAAIPYQSIVEHMTRRHHEYMGTNCHQPNGFIDSSCKPGNSHKGYLNDKPFEATMRELAQDLAAANGQNGAASTNGVGEKHVNRLTDHAGNGVYVAPKKDTPMSF